GGLRPVVLVVGELGRLLVPPGTAAPLLVGGLRDDALGRRRWRGGLVVGELHLQPLARGERLRLLGSAAAGRNARRVEANERGPAGCVIGAGGAGGAGRHLHRRRTLFA